MAVLGASFDSQDENRAFREKQGFPFPLLSDTDRALAVAYGAAADASAGFPNRITVVVNPDGKVHRVYEQVSVKSHAETVLADLQ